jgi:diguanylate cyclase (GGDEF)-like protein
MLRKQHPFPLILIIDDDRFMRLQLRQVMQQEGYRVEDVANGKQGLDAYQRLQPDLILLDALMPVMDGFTFCQHLQTLRGGDRTPVLMITGLEDQTSVDQAFEAGATDFVTKPIHWAVLRQRVRRALREARLSWELEQANQDLQRANRELQRLAISDSLTQVANRRRFDEYLAQEWQRLSREQAPLSLILCDVDFFKAYNDTYGHQAGDRCLRQIAQAISLTASRPADLVARYGGEELVVILPNTPAPGALQVAEDIRQQVRNLEITHAKSLIGDYVTLSMGIAGVVPSAKLQPDMLITAADQALYEAKAGGRDMIVVADP